MYPFLCDTSEEKVQKKFGFVNISMTNLNNERNSTRKPYDSFTARKSLDGHQKDIENIVREKEGRIIGKKWKEVSHRNRPYFHIECNKGHTWWVLKDHLKPKPSKPEGSWCPHFECKSRTLTDHQREIEDIVRTKRGKIIGNKWREIGQKKDKTPYFHIECGEGHKWWVSKINLTPSLSRPEGTWCPRCPRGKSLDDHQREIEDIVRTKRGKIIGKKWKEISGRKKSYFHVECDKGHEWWVYKGSLKPSLNKPEGTWCPICQDRISAIGTFGHVPIEYFSLIHLNSKGCKVEHEKTLEEGTRPDLVIYRDDSFKANIETHQNIFSFSDNIEEILVDFTISLTPPTILRKCFKKYQGETRFLLIILMRERKHVTAQNIQNLINIDADIDSEDKKRIKVINFDEYLDFLNLGRWNFLKSKEEKNIESMLRGIITLCRNSFDSDSSLKKLVNLSEKYAKLLGIKFVKQKYEKFKKLDRFFD